MLRLLQTDSAMTQRLAAAGLRVLLKALPSSQLYTLDDDGKPQPVLDSSYCVAAVSLLSSFNLQLLYETGQLFNALMATEQLEEPLVRARAANANQHIARAAACTRVACRW